MITTQEGITVKKLRIGKASLLLFLILSMVLSPFVRAAEEERRERGKYAAKDRTLQTHGHFHSFLSLFFVGKFLGEFGEIP